MSYVYHFSKLKNGVRIATAEMPYMESVCVGVWAAVGGRYESKQLNGISHFIEHLLFKGTAKRNARSITASVEGVGGYLNAFTTEDHTCYYAKAAAEHFDTLIDVLLDMYTNSTFEPAEIERERGIIREEILMCRDQPSQYVHELLSSVMWPKHALGRALTGTCDSIAWFQREHVVDFLRENYNGRTTVVTVAGRMKHEDVVERLRPHLEKLPSGKSPRFDAFPGPNGGARVKTCDHETEQAHIAMGFHTFGRSDERRFALKILSVILGENMSSRLFQRLREKLGFCYSVQSGTVGLAEAGLLSIYAAMEARNLQKAIGIVMQEIERICKKPPSTRELRRAQEYTIGQTLMGLESTTNQMLWVGESIIGYGHILDPDEIRRKLMAVSAREVQEVACKCLHRGNLGIALVGPVKDATPFERWVS